MFIIADRFISFKRIESEFMEILVIDDEEEVREYLKDVLESVGHKVITAGEVKEGLDTQIEKKFDLVIMDLKMPKINGKEIIEIIRVRRPELPVIILSGHIESENELLRLGASKVIPKPIEMGILFDSINELTKPHSDH